MKATFIQGTILLFYLCVPYEAKSLEDAQYLTNLYNQFYNAQQQQTPQYYPQNYGVPQYTNSIVPTNFYQQNPNVYSSWQSNPWNAGQYSLGANQLGNSIFPYYVTNSDTPVFAPVNG